MTNSAPTPQESAARAAYEHYVATRDRIEAGELPWSALAEFFTEDAVLVDPAWGRTQGREHLAVFFDRSMQGLEQWEFPETWTMVDGNRIVSFWWNRLPGARADGSPYQAPAVSILHYAGDGKFSYELDILNMAEVTELIGESGWLPTNMNFPPPLPDRNAQPPNPDQAP